MLVASFIGFLALATAVVIVFSAVRKHQDESGVETSWSDVKAAFRAHAIRGVRQESAHLSAPKSRDTDVRVGELFAESEEGSGYLEPRDILTRRSERR